MVKNIENRVEKHIITKSHPMYTTCEIYTRYSKNLYNLAMYYIRQEFITSGKYIGSFINMGKNMKEEEAFKNIGSNSGQQTLKIVDRNWKSFFNGLKEYNKNPSKFLGRPQIPKYLPKNGKYVWILQNVQSKIVDGYLKFSFKPLKPFNNLIKTNVEGKHSETRIVPKSNYFVLEIVYQKQMKELSKGSGRIMGIDLGLNNLMTIQTNTGYSPFIINGRPLKSYNQYYNMKKSKIQSELKKVNGLDWSNRLSDLTRKRHNKVEDYLHRASRYIVNYCLAMNIDTVVIGKNKKWKQEFRRQRNFVQIPFENLIQQLDYKLREIGIRVFLTEESYTSRASFIDNDEMKKGVEFRGVRVHRGLYSSLNGLIINADVNGASNIIRKVFSEFKYEIKGVGLSPSVVNLQY